MLQPTDKRNTTPVRILGVQKRIYTIGKIRIGDEKTDPKRPGAKLSTFRLTSPDRKVLDTAARLYGGVVKEWVVSETRREWQLVTKAKELPIMISPIPVSQFYEDWFGGECKRRCTGETELLTMEPCICNKQDKLVCKPVTRFSVILPELEGFGVWLLESRGWTAASELTTTTDMLLNWTRHFGIPLRVTLALETRQSRKTVNGKPVTFKFAVPVLRVPFTPDQILSMRANRNDGTLSLIEGEAPPMEAIEAGARPISENSEATMTENWRARYFALHAELGYPAHTDERKDINYRVWTAILGRPVGSDCGGSTFVLEDWRRLTEFLELVREDKVDEPTEWEQYRLSKHATQLDLGD